LIAVPTIACLPTVLCPPVVLIKDVPNCRRQVGGFPNACPRLDMAHLEPPFDVTMCTGGRPGLNTLDPPGPTPEHSAPPDSDQEIPKEFQAPSPTIRDWAVLELRDGGPREQVHGVPKADRNLRIVRFLPVLLQHCIASRDGCLINRRDGPLLIWAELEGRGSPNANMLPSGAPTPCIKEANK